VRFRNSTNSNESYEASFDVGPYLLQSSGHSTVDVMKLTFVVKVMEQDIWECHMPMAAAVIMIWLWWTFEITMNHCLHCSVITVCNLLYSQPITIFNPLLHSYIKLLTLFFCHFYLKKKMANSSILSVIFTSFILCYTQKTLQWWNMFHLKVMWHIYFSLYFVQEWTLWPTCQI
jgi:hypothetical protein